MKYEWLKALNQIKMKVSGNCSGHFSLPFWVSIEVEKNLENNWDGKRRITLSSDRFFYFSSWSLSSSIFQIFLCAFYLIEWNGKGRISALAKSENRLYSTR